MTLYPSKSGPPNRAIFGALGRLIYAFAQLEGALLEALITALGDTEEAYTIVVGLNFRQALDRFSVIYARLGSANDTPAISHLSATIGSLNEERNKHIHAVWGFWGSGEPARIRRRLERNKAVSLHMESIDPRSVEKLATKMDEQTEIVYRLRDRYLAERTRK